MQTEIFVFFTLIVCAFTCDFYFK